jgi:23S rRNA pseudouridine955/2504/2580 synthase
VTETAHTATHIKVSDAESGQRLDNFLLRKLSGVPKTRIYRAIRKGEVRVDKGRAKPERKLSAGEVIRIPPIGSVERPAKAEAPARWNQRIAQSLVYEDKGLIIINKPTGLAVHGGSGIDFGLIETLRQQRLEQPYLELVHRLDRDTSGLVMIAKRASVLRELHDLLRNDGIDKRYLALVAGKWPSHLARVQAKLGKSALSSGERMVRVDASGKPSITDFRVVERLAGATLVEAKPITGRTHQIRVHAQHAGHPILGDVKYSDDGQLAVARDAGLRRLFLHACSLRFELGGKTIEVRAELDEELSGVCESLSLEQ